MKLSANQAARTAKVSATTITRAIKSGKLSATPTDDGSGWLIDPAELDRWQGNRTQGAAQPSQGDTAQRGDAATAQGVEIRMLREMLDEMRARAERAEVRAERAESLVEKQSDQLGTSTRLIEDLSRKRQAERQGSIWDRLRGLLAPDKAA